MVRAGSGTSRPCRQAIFLPIALERASQRGNYRGGELTWRPPFAGHVFVELDPGRDLARLQRIDGVDGLLAPIAGEVIAALRAAEQQGDFDRAGGWRLIACSA